MTKDDAAAVGLWVVVAIGWSALMWMIGDTMGRHYRDEDAVRQVVVRDAGEADALPEAAISAAPTSPLPVVTLHLPASPDDVPTWVDPVGVARDPDMEVCRSINTSCGGFYDQSRCKKGPRSWTAILTPGEVNCVVAAQGLVDGDLRVRWIRNCAPKIDCRFPY